MGFPDNSLVRSNSVLRINRSTRQGSCSPRFDAENETAPQPPMSAEELMPLNCGPGPERAITEEKKILCATTVLRPGATN